MRPSTWPDEDEMVADPKSRRRSARAEAKRDLIVDCAMKHFAEHGYQGARIEDMAADLGIAKGSIFQHFGSKAGLFLEAYKRAVTALPGWLDAPDEVRSGGFFGIVRYWLGRTEHYVAEDWVPYRVSLIGNYGTDLELKREINRFMVSEDPYGTLEFVEWGQQRGEVRADLDLETIVSLVDWLSSAIQDALVSEELDPGLFHRWRHQPDRQRMRLEHFAVLLESAIGSDAARAHVL
jgi:AcrR family transcriptional regulator